MLQYKWDGIPNLQISVNNQKKIHSILVRYLRSFQPIFKDEVNESTQDFLFRSYEGNSRGLSSFIQINSYVRGRLINRVVNENAPDTFKSLFVKYLCF